MYKATLQRVIRDYTYTYNITIFYNTHDIYNKVKSKAIEANVNQLIKMH